MRYFFQNLDNNTPRIRDYRLRLFDRRIEFYQWFFSKLKHLTRLGLEQFYFRYTITIGCWNIFRNTSTAWRTAYWPLSFKLPQGQKYMCFWVPDRCLDASRLSRISKVVLIFFFGRYRSYQLIATFFFFFFRYSGQDFFFYKLQVPLFLLRMHL